MYKHLKSVAIVAFLSTCATLLATNTVSNNNVTGQVAPFSTPNAPKAELEKEVSQAGKSAIEAGMPSLARAILESNIQRAPYLENSKIVNAVYVDALISLGEYNKAEQVVKTLTDLSPANTIRRALIMCGLGKGELAKSGIETLNSKAIPEALISWFYLVKGYIHFENGEKQQALTEFAKAKQYAKSSLASADADVAIHIVKLSSTDNEKDLETLAEELKSKVQTFIGTPEGFQYAKQCASVLFRLGKENEALYVINQQLEIALAPEIDKEELNIISAAMTKDANKQLEILSDVLRKTTSPEIVELAIELISSNRKISSERIDKMLSDVFDNVSVKIKDRIIIERAKCAIKAKKREQAMAFAQNIVEEYPTSKYKSDALRILAWVAWENKPPQYRLAAANLSELANMQDTQQQKDEFMYLAATCYFMDKDYATAANIFEQVASKIPEKQGAILNRIVEAYLAQGNEEKALSFTDKSYNNKTINEEEIWNAEWKIISYYTQSNLTEKALERIDKAIETSANFSALLKMRMMWLRAIISEQSQNYSRTVKYCNNIIDLVQNTEDISNIESEIVANTMLLKASSLEKLAGTENKKQSINTYVQLRKNYSKTEAVPLSYLYQARVEASLGHFDSAHKLCITLAQDEKNPQYRYDALIDAAEYQKKIATESSYREALKILDTLCSEYPNDPRNFYARLWQADILRLINSFSNARKLYYEITNKFEHHPEVFLAWLGLGDSIMAQQPRPTDAISIFERLYALPNIPLSAKAEAAFKWSFALRKSNRNSEANEVAWLTSNALLKNENLDALTKYWIGRNLYTMAESLEEKSFTRDAISAYNLLIKYKLPSYKMAEQKLKISKQK
ncbi:MAG: tetratricopeptide repeat protein [Verrucomicrobiaceae bacterium]|nr:tetratricopeptide repeat protein [Verrucomicrobiaceae bacterium]